MSTNGLPTTSTPAEVRFGRTGSGFVGLVAASDRHRIVVAQPASSGAPSSSGLVGRRAQLVWADTEGSRALPVELSAVQHAAVPLWHFRAVGPPVMDQRRAAVRVPLHVPVQLRTARRAIAGATLDLSEVGLRCIVDGMVSDMPVAGETVPMTLLLQGDSDPIELRGELVMLRQRTDASLTAVLAFVGLQRRDQDRLRARVFQEIRARRSKGWK
jgi:c-di-GMP-binding flagellar brake protein YcgR